MTATTQTEAIARIIQELSFACQFIVQDDPADARISIESDKRQCDDLLLKLATEPAAAGGPGNLEREARERDLCPQCGFADCEGWPSYER